MHAYNWSDFGLDSGVEKTETRLGAYLTTVSSLGSRGMLGVKYYKLEVVSGVYERFNIYELSFKFIIDNGFFF
jgi:hypothetical protein